MYVVSCSYFVCRSPFSYHIILICCLPVQKMDSLLLILIFFTVKRKQYISQRTQYRKQKHRRNCNDPNVVICNIKKLSKTEKHNSVSVSSRSSLCSVDFLTDSIPELNMNESTSVTETIYEYDNSDQPVVEKVAEKIYDCHVFDESVAPTVTPHRRKRDKIPV